jgi:hypothetical protein
MGRLETWATDAQGDGHRAGSDEDPVLRAGSVPYLNAAPLVRGLEGRLRLLPPSRLAVELQAGRLDAGLVSVTEPLLHDGYDILDGYGVASDGEVFSVFLAHRGRLEDVRRGALRYGVIDERESPPGVAGGAWAASHVRAAGVGRRGGPGRGGVVDWRSGDCVSSWETGSTRFGIWARRGGNGRAYPSSMRCGRCGGEPTQIDCGGNWRGRVSVGRTRWKGLSRNRPYLIRNFGACI